MYNKIEEKLINDFKYFNKLREDLLYNPLSDDFVCNYMEEWNLKDEFEIEENIEQREASSLFQAADKLGISFKELNIWLCNNL